VPLPGQPPLDASRSREGSLRETPFALLLDAVAAQKRTVLLELERGPMRKRIVVEDGVPVDCRSNLVHETLGRFLAATGRLDEAQSDALIRESLVRRLPLGQVLLEKGLLAPIELFRLLQQNLAKKLLDLFTWREGRYRLVFEVPKVDSPLKVNVAQLVVMGVTRFAPQEEVNAAVGRLVGTTLALHPAPRFPIEEIRLSARHSRILPPLRQTCRPDELFSATGLPPDELSRLLYALALLGTVVPADQLPARPAPTPAPPPPPPPRPVAPVADPAADEKLRNDLVQAYLGHRSQDAFDLLGLPEDAGAGQIQERYLAFALRFSPARFEAEALRGELDKARDLFLAAARAYGELCDMEHRNSLVNRRRTLRSEAARRPPPDFTIKTDLLDPEAQYRKALALMASGQYHEALSFLEFAADCDPGTGKYRAELAWCRFRELGRMAAAPGLELLEETLRIDPKCGLADLYSGEIHRSLGHLEDAERHFRRALKLMAPDRRPVEALKALQKQR
jgi:hypothetical protein